MAIIAVIGGPRWVKILKIYEPGDLIDRPGIVTTLSEKGDIGYYGLGSLLTVEGYLRHCEHMRDDWTGREYREMIAAAHRPFVAPPKWEEWITRAMEPVTT
jgi:hypothetical protein